MCKSLFAQSESYSKQIDQFELNYNAGKYDAIFNSFSVQMKRSLPQDRAIEFLTGLKDEVGKITHKEFIGFEQSTFATYKTSFEKMVLAVNISLDSENLINGFYIKPFEEPVKTNANIINDLSGFPTEISQMIYSKTKDFPNNTQLSIAVMQNGKTNYYGVIKTNNSIKPIENQYKVFEIGSITKVFTSTVLANLVLDNKIKLSNNVNDYFDFPFLNDTKISLESLANHTSGLPTLPENLEMTDQQNPYKDYGGKELEMYLNQHLKLQNNEKSTYDYSNLGVGLLGYTLGVSQKTSFEKLLQKNVFDKFQMKQSFTSSSDVKDQLVKGQDMNGKTVSNWDFDALFAAGGILSTTHDLANFAKAQFDPKNKALALTRTATFSIDKNMQIGLGWYLIKSPKGKDLVWHNGGTGGYSSSMAVNVKAQTAVIILSNLSAFHSKMENIDQLCFELIDGIQ